MKKALFVLLTLFACTMVSAQASDIILNLSKQKIMYLARQRAQYWSGRIDGYFQVLRTISNIMNYYEHLSAGERREKYETIMISVFDDQPDFFSMFTVWKPNALDGLDSRFISRPGSIETGQFALALEKENGLIALQTSQDVQSVMEYINGPNARKESVNNPTVLSQPGINTYLVRLMIPIINKRTNEVVGAVGCYLNIDFIQPRIENTIKNYEEINAISVYSGNGFIMASYRVERIGKMMVDAEIQFGDYINEAFKAVKAGNEFSCFGYAPTLRTNIQIFVIPIPLGNSGTTWSIMIGTTEDYIMKDVKAAKKYLGVKKN
jgi:methyl-accepting chemotaxis protein